VSRVRRAFCFLVGGTLLVVLGVALVPGPTGAVPVSSARAACGQLRALIQAEGEYRAGGADGPSPRGYWRADVAGLCSSDPRSETHALVDPRLARSDDRPSLEKNPTPERVPFEGYWFRSIRFEGESALDPGRFAFCAFPDSAASSQGPTLIADQAGNIYLKRLGPRARGITEFPMDPPSAGWRRIIGAPPEQK
jgi:hypothetical protein